MTDGVFMCLPEFYDGDDGPKSSDAVTAFVQEWEIADDCDPEPWRVMFAAALTEYGEQVRARAIERIGPATPDAPLDTEFVKGYRLCLRECIDRLRALPVHCAAEPPKGEVG